MQNPLRSENQWKEINKALNFFKLLSLLGACAVVLCLIITLGSAFSSPVVVVKDKVQNCFVDAQRSPVIVTDDDIIQFIRNWVFVRYEWEALDEERLIKNLAPFTSEGLLAKIRDQFKSGPEKEFKDKAVVQYVSKNIRVDLSDNKVVATFDRILRINEIPIVDPAQMIFTLVKGTTTRMNPHGIYVNGITEYKSN